MNPFWNLSVPEQLATHLRGEIVAGRLHGLMPGVLRLETEMGVNRKTVEEALRILEREGLLIPQGVGKRRKIEQDQGVRATTSLRLGILLYEKNDRNMDYIIELQHSLEEAGHIPFYPPKSLVELGMEVGRVERMIGRTEADAWVVVAGTRAVLEWFIAQGMPVMATFGRRRGLPIASVGPDKPPAIRAAAKALLALGHRRVVFLTRSGNVQPRLCATAQSFLHELSAHGITPSPYHLPEWKETIEGFHACLEGLFRITPPTAMIIDEVPFLIATYQFLAARKLSVPQDISLVCAESSRDFAWCRPEISHIRWAAQPVVRHIVQWANHLAAGKSDVRQLFTLAEFVPGGTIGPPKRLG